MCCPFYNENLVANVNISEASKWVDEIHITECNKSFKYGDHEYCFHLNEPNEKVYYHQLDGNKYYLKPRMRKNKFIPPHILLKPVSRWMKHFCYGTAWYNEGASRNHSLWNANYSDDDILILSDVDEIIDSRCADEIISEVKKHGIITVKIYFTQYYFNLFCRQWSGPDGYSYRIFAVRGDVMRKQYYNDSDFLRKQGESSKLLDSIRCLDGYKGFHHSWLGDENFIATKMMSYAHPLEWHNSGCLNERGEPDVTVIKQMLKEGKPVLGDTPLEVDNTIELLETVETLREKESIHFI